MLRSMIRDVSRRHRRPDAPPGVGGTTEAVKAHGAHTLAWIRAFPVASESLYRAYPAVARRTPLPSRPPAAER